MGIVGVRHCSYEHMIIEYEKVSEFKLSEKNWNIIKKVAEEESGIFILTFKEPCKSNRSTHLMQVTKRKELKSIFRHFFGTDSQIFTTYKVRQLGQRAKFSGIEGFICRENKQVYKFINSKGVECNPEFTKVTAKVKSSSSKGVTEGDDYGTEMCTFEKDGEMQILNNDESYQAQEQAGEQSCTFSPRVNEIFLPSIDLQERHSGIVSQLQEVVHTVCLMHGGARNNQRHWLHSALQGLPDDSDSFLLFKDTNGHSALQLALSNNHPSLFKMLYESPAMKQKISGMSGNEKALLAQGVMWAAVEAQNYSMLDYLQNKDEIKSGLSISTNNSLYPLLGLAATRSGYTRMFGKLINVFELDVNSVDQSKKLSCLMYAICRDAELGAIKLLVRYGVDLKAQDCFGNTALHYAVAKQNIICIRFLKECLDEDECQVKNYDGKTAYQVSVDIVQKAVMGAKIDYVKPYSQFIYGLMSYRKDRALGNELVFKRFPNGKQQTCDNLFAYINDIYYHTFIKDDVEMFQTLLIITVRLCEVNAINVPPPLCENESSVKGVIHKTNANELQDYLLASCCVQACMASAFEVLRQLSQTAQAKIAFKKEIHVNICDPNNKKNRQLMPLAVAAAYSKTPLVTLDCLLRIGINFDLRFGLEQQTVLMSVIEVNASHEVIEWYIEQSCETLSERDKSNNNVLHYLFCYQPSLHEKLILRIVNTTENSSLLTEKNNNGFVPIQMICRQIKQSGTEPKSEQLRNMLVYYRDQNELYLVRQMIKYDLHHLKVGLLRSSLCEDCQQLIKYSQFVDKLVTYLKASPTGTCKDEHSTVQIRKIITQGYESKELDLFIKYIESEKSPSEVYFLLNEDNSLLKSLLVTNSEPKIDETVLLDEQLSSSANVSDNGDKEQQCKVNESQPAPGLIASHHSDTEGLATKLNSTEQSAVDKFESNPLSKGVPSNGTFAKYEFDDGKSEEYLNKARSMVSSTLFNPDSGDKVRYQVVKDKIGKSPNTNKVIKPEQNTKIENSLPVADANTNANRDLNAEYDEL